MTTTERIEQAKELLQGLDFLLYVKDTHEQKHILEFRGNPVIHLETVDHMLVINAHQEETVQSIQAILKELNNPQP